MPLAREQKLFGLLRIGLGWIFLWAFIDKLFGLGFATAPGSAWLAGGSPTAGFLQFGTHGPLMGIFQSLAGNIFIDWLFMLGLLGIGAALILGIGMRIATYAGALLVFLMWLALIPPENNPFLDEHLIYLIALLALNAVKAGQFYGLGNWWRGTSLVQKYPVLE